MEHLFLIYIYDISNLRVNQPWNYQLLNKHFAPSNYSIRLSRYDATQLGKWFTAFRNTAMVHFQW